VFFAGHDDWCNIRNRRDPLPGRLQHGLLASQRQELLRIGFPRQRPQARTGSTGQQDGLQNRHGNGLPFASKTPQFTLCE